jgi:hypothetical protein
MNPEAINYRRCVRIAIALSFMLFTYRDIDIILCLLFDQERETGYGGPTVIEFIFLNLGHPDIQSLLFSEPIFREDSGTREYDKQEKGYSEDRQEHFHGDSPFRLNWSGCVLSRQST